MTNTNLTVTEGTKISEEELLALGCRFIDTFGTKNSKVFEREESQFIYWDSETQIIWRILSKK